LESIRFENLETSRKDGKWMEMVQHRAQWPNVEPFSSNTSEVVCYKF